VSQAAMRRCLDIHRLLHEQERWRRRPQQAPTASTAAREGASDGRKGRRSRGGSRGWRRREQGRKLRQGGPGLKESCNGLGLKESCSWAS
jgi:hypothetical protein